jgi:hypothetical protein
MPITATSIIKVSSDQVSADLENESIVLGLERGMYYGLDDVASIVWGMLEAPRSVSEIRDRLLREYEVDPEECERDLVAFLGELHTEGLIEVQDGPLP